MLRDAFSFFGAVFVAFDTLLSNTNCLARNELVAFLFTPVCKSGRFILLVVVFFLATGFSTGADAVEVFTSRICLAFCIKFSLFVFVSTGICLHAFYENPQVTVESLRLEQTPEINMQVDKKK